MVKEKNKADIDNDPFKNKQEESNLFDDNLQPLDNDCYDDDEDDGNDEDDYSTSYGLFIFGD